MNILNKEKKNNEYNDIIVKFMKDNNLKDLNGSIRKGSYF